MSAALANSTLAAGEESPTDEPHRVCSIDCTIVSKREYPTKAEAEVACEEYKAKFGGLWWPAHHSYFKPVGTPGTDAVDTI